MIKEFIISNKKPILIFLLMLILGLALIFILAQRNGLGMFSRSDANEFQNVVKNLLNHRPFSLETQPPFYPTNFRTPGYVFFLILVYLIFSSFEPAVFIGAVLFALSAPLVFLIAKKIFSEKIALPAAIIFAIEPWALFQSGFLVAEQLFMPVFLLAIYFFCGYLKENSRKLLYWSSFVMGLSALTRPLALFFILIFLLLAFISEFKFSFKKALVTTAWLFLIFISVLSPWIIRNKIVLNTWKISSISDVNLYIENYAMLEKYLGKMRPDEDINEVGRLLLGTKSYGEAERTNNAQILAGVALKEIKANFGSYLAMHFKASPLFLVRNSYGNIFLDLGIAGSDIQSKFLRHLSRGDLSDAFYTITKAPLGSKILFALSFFWPIVIFFAVFGIFKGFKSTEKIFFWFLIFWVLYFLALAGNLRDISRYKLTIAAPLFIFSALGFYRILKYFKHEISF